MKKIFALILAIICILSFAAGCTEAERVSQNVSMQADNFNVVRQFVAINVRTDKPIMEIIGRLSVLRDDDGDINVIVETENGSYKKHMIGNSAWIEWSVLDISGVYADPYHYEINIQPQAFSIITFTSVN